MKIYEILGYDGLNIGDNDLVLGVEYLRMLQEHSKIHFLSANIKEKETGKPIFTPYLVKEIGDIRIGIIGLVTPDKAHPVAGEIENYSIEDPTMAAIEIINGPMVDCDHIIALAHLNSSEIESLTQVAPQISIIIGGHDRSPVLPREINGAIWVQTDAFGLSIGKLDLKFLKGSSTFVDVTQRNSIQKHIDEIQKKIEDPRYVNEADDLKRMKEILIEARKTMPDPTGKNTYENRLELLHPKMTSDLEIEQLISSSKDR